MMTYLNYPKYLIKLHTHFKRAFILFYLQTMQKPCAYCKEFGHHIRACGVLELKNRRQQYPALNRYTPPSIVKVSITNSFPVRTNFEKPTKNTFAELYSSSDDEVEEGEIVEEDRPHRLRVAIVSDSDSDSDSTCSLPPPPPPSRSDNGWKRSGTIVVKIPMVVVENKRYEQPEVEEELSEETLAEIARFSAFMQKLRGRSWADIEYDDDLRYFE